MSSAADSSRLKVLSVGSNPISAFLSWRLTASNATDVSLVWKSQYDIVYNYGVSFKSDQLGTQRFRPYQVVKSVDDVTVPPGGYDYILLCVKALPDVYDLSAVIQSVVTPGHTCIVVNTTCGLGIESYFDEAFKDNVVLSLVCDTAVTQTGPADFEQTDSAAQFWLGANAKYVPKDASLVDDMAESFALTLEAGSVKCNVSKNIRQQQWEKSIGPIAFHPLSVIMEESNLSSLISLPRARSIISGVISELVQIAKSQACVFDEFTFAPKIIDTIVAVQKQSMMFQDYVAKRPMEIEVMLSNPLKMADAAGIKTPRLEMLYILLSRLNKVNQSRTSTSSTSSNPPPISRQSSITPIAAARRPPPPSANGYANRRPGPHAAPPTPNGYPKQNGYGHRPSASISRKSSCEGLEEFSEVVAYANGSASSSGGNTPNGTSGHMNGTAPVPSLQDLTMRERELELRRRELMLREREMMLPQRGARPLPMRTQTGPASSVVDLTMGEADGDYFTSRGSRMGQYDDVDMLSVTSRRNRRTGSVVRNLKSADPSIGNVQRHGKPIRKLSSGADLSPAALDYYESFIDSPLLSYTSDRYHSVDTRVLTDQSRANSMSSNVQRPMYPTAPSSQVATTPAAAAPPAPTSPRWRYAGPPKSVQEPVTPGIHARMLRSMAGAGPSPMDAMMTAVKDTYMRPSSPNPQGLPTRGHATAMDQQLFAGKDAPQPVRRRSLTGSASASASTSNENGSGNSSSASSLEQK
ncbi:ketopantoate reductase PanE/ApbA C terminal-domain-containing protein [Lipomyces tetrasporus]|uniref:Ketopantoate reductase PanE/ApbA C terminal-domain-containing protein n=1 Tax=Lipomyces tetrasporus TaxID=54092 RepID=A0AAD7QLV9_9ASCO|nr:ketopantoate reductase PanE/ApbA C terminal-domain-containing protein [Lipomyces tetrasporus]KAJ8097544.1 ketopantoate reductase PanE/ApbA C terminal-domain-containing protein [Lipomyces tetrasporus]